MSKDDEPVCCPFCLSLDPNKVGIEQATGIVCRHEFHCPSPEFHGNPFRFCQWCSWSEDGEAARTFSTDANLKITEAGAAVVESGLSLRQAHEIKTGCSPDQLCDECKALMHD